MNVEVTVAEWLATASAEITAGTNLFVGDFMEDIDEGICVMLNRQLQADGTMSRANIQILLFYYDYIVGRTLMQTIVGLLDVRRGTIDGSWTVAGGVYADGLGKDHKSRNVFSIEFETAYKE